MNDTVSSASRGKDSQFVDLKVIEESKSREREIFQKRGMVAAIESVRLLF